MPNATLLKQIWPSLFFLLFFSAVFGFFYPGVVMFINQLAFPKQANGSLIIKEVILGSELIGQPFSQSKYFWSRPSGTLIPYDASHSRGTNLCPANTQLIQQIKTRIHALSDLDPDNLQPIPIDLITASASGLDPHISLAAAYYQAHRVAAARQVDPEIINEAIEDVCENQQLGFLGEKRVNVVKLNLRLDRGKNL